MTTETTVPRPFRKTPEPIHDKEGRLTPPAVKELQVNMAWNDMVRASQEAIGKSGLASEIIERPEAQRKAAMQALNDPAKVKELVRKLLE